MLTEIYIEALLVDEELADHIWKAWDGSEINNLTAYLSWLAVVLSCPSKDNLVAD